MTIDAVSHSEVHWHAINWPKVYRTVRRLQARIVKATQEGKWRKVRALQRLLTHSFSGKALAVRKVTENQGKRIPGLDGEIWDTPKKKAAAVSRLKRQSIQIKATRIQTPTTEAGVYSKKQWEETSFGHCYHAGQGYASSLSVSSRPSGGDPS